jgi:hypothetical protein
LRAPERIEKQEAPDESANDPGAEADGKPTGRREEPPEKADAERHSRPPEEADAERLDRRLLLRPKGPPSVTL